MKFTHVGEQFRIKPLKCSSRPVTIAVPGKPQWKNKTSEKKKTQKSALNTNK